MSLNSYNLDDIIVGTYYIDNKTIALNYMLKYSYNGCFIKDFKTILGEVKDNKIILEIDRVKYEFVKDIGNNETITNINYYVINPINGEKPKGLLNTWKDCTSKITKNTN